MELHMFFSYELRFIILFNSIPMKPIIDIAYYTNVIECIELKNVPAQ
jgi:hypothetical protein